MIAFGNRRFLRNIILIILVVASISGYNKWKLKPYCTIEHKDSLTILGKKSDFRYILSKLIIQRRELRGNDPYAMYIYISDPNGIKSVNLNVDGIHYPLDVIPNVITFEKEIPGNRAYGLHRYSLDVVDGKGDMGHSESHMKVSAVGVGVVM